MAITEVKIHPAIGIARVGNSPTEFFIGPERPWDRTAPAGGYKDSQCRVKRQAARFRLFAYHDVGPPTEITAAHGDITWTVHLANRKAVNFHGVGATIDPGPRTLDGPDQLARFDTGTFTLPAAPVTTVPLGEIRTDDDGHLLVLGGFGKSASPLGTPVTSLDNAGWYDDTSDGPVTATVTIGADTFTAAGAWVVVGPPKFGAAIDNVVTLWDRLFQVFVAAGTVPAPAVVSYTTHIYPILQAANNASAVRQTASGHHGFVHPVVNPAQRLAIYSKLKLVGGNMPPLSNVTLTPTQYQLMLKWRDGTFTNDWTGVPVPPTAITPDGLDKAALENAVGADFDPGIEAGTFLLSAANYSAPFRLNHATVLPGRVTDNLSLPWQADFKACSDDYWPVPRPNQVMRNGSYAEWTLPGVTSATDMVNKWHTLGFVVRQGPDLVEVDRCDLANAFVNLVTPALTFTDIAQGPMGTSRTASRAAVFEVTSPVPVTLDVISGPTDPSLTVVSPDPLSAGPSVGSEVLDARVRVNYTAPNDTHAVLDSITVTCAQTSQTWVIPIAANAVPRKTAAVALVLDKSGSMNEDRGDGGTKIQSLREAAQVFVDVMLGGDLVSLVAFNHDAAPVAPLTPLGDPADPADPGRVAIAAAIAGPGLNAGGATSIGDGIHEGRVTLAGTTADVSSLLVLTDGKQNQPRWIADVAAEIDERTYAIGLGTAANTSAAELQTVSGNHGGYLLVTGPITGGNSFVLEKHFLQILSGVSNAEVVLDPSGLLLPGVEQRIPFSLTEVDRAVDVILLTDAPDRVRFGLATPNGELIDPVVAPALAGVDFVAGANVAYYRLTLPTEVRTQRPEQDGTWHAIVEQPANGNDDEVRYRPTRRRLPFSVIVHAWSDLALTAAVRQRSFEPGATAVITASMTDAEVPVTSAAVWAEVTSPAGDASRVPLTPAGSGWEATLTMPAPGTYAVRVRASGTSRKGAAFRRERTMTASVWHGGDSEPVRRASDPDAGALVRCLVEQLATSDGLVELLRRHDVDVKSLLKCVRGHREPTE